MTELRVIRSEFDEEMSDTSPASVLAGSEASANISFLDSINSDDGDFGAGSPLLDEKRGPKKRYGRFLLFIDFANVMKTFFGSNFLGMPFAFSQSGIVVGLIVLLFVSALVSHCCLLLTRTKHRLAKYVLLKDGALKEGFIDTYGKMGSHLFGFKGKLACEIPLIFTQFGFCVGYNIFVSQNLYFLFNEMVPLYCCIFISVSVLFPLVYIKQIRSLGIISLLANVLLLIGMSLLLSFFRWTEASDWPSFWSLCSIRWSTLPICMGICISSFEGSGLVLPVESSMKDKKGRYRLLLRISLIVMAILLSFFSVAGFASFGSATNQVITLNLPPNSVRTDIVIVCLVMAISLTYPLQLMPVSEVLERCLFKGSQDKYCMWKPNLCRTILVLCTGGIAYLLPMYGLFAALIGSLGCAMLAFMLPPIFHLSHFLGTGGSRFSWITVKDVSIAVFGVLAAIIGTTVSVYDIVLALLPTNSSSDVPGIPFNNSYSFSSLSPSSMDSLSSN